MDRQKAAKAQEELELDQDPTEKLKSGPRKAPADQYSEKERKLKARERRLLEKVQGVLKEQES